MASVPLTGPRSGSPSHGDASVCRSGEHAAGADVELCAFGLAPELPT